MKIRELAEMLGAVATEFATGDEEIRYPTTIEDGAEGAVTFIANPHYERHLTTTKATAVIVSEYLTAPTDGSVHIPALIRVKRPYEAFAKTLEIFNPKKDLLEAGIHPSAVIHSTAEVDPSAKIGAHVCICECARVDAEAEIFPGVYLGANCSVGKHTAIHPNAVIYDRVVIGDHVVIGPGSVIGFDGFGYVPMGDGSYLKIPQVGNVVIEDDVEIGANTTIDRATVSETRIRRGAKLDNLIQIAHNVEIGENTVIAAQAGISGSTKIGKNNIIAGQVGVVGHIETTDQVVVGAQSGISKSLLKSGTYFGSPARNHRDALRLEGAIRSLPELTERVKRLEELLAQEQQ
jgi:UDP-3-O-[3-hydroxymyristoyl] glucosamine N-acyltransferase